MNYEISVINAILDSGDIVTALENNVQDVFHSYADIWTYVHDFYQEYGKLPSKDIVKEHFSDFEFINATDAPLQYYIDEAHKQSLSMNLRREIKRSIEILNESGPQSALNFITSQGLRLMKTTGALRDTNIVDEYHERVDNFRHRLDSEDHFVGIPSGINVIDQSYGGWQGGDFIIILGWTGSMKSWLARMFAVNAWQKGYTPLIISLEMNKEQEGYRMDTLLNQGETFKNSDLMLGRGTTVDAYEEWAKKQFEGKHPIYLVTSEGLDAATQNVVAAKIEQYKPDLVILDYHNLFEDAKNGGNETARAMNLSKDFKKYAVKYNVPIIDVAAVTMQDGQGERAPELREVAWSKQLAYDADLVLAIHRQEGSDMLQIVSRKVRRGNDFAFYLQWDVDSGKRKEMFDI